THATATGTQRFAARAQTTRAGFTRAFPRSLAVGALGLGTYLGDCTDEEDARYRDIVRAALAAGINVLDTASNYRCQRSERAVGQAVNEAVAAGAVRRDELVVCTKGGYVALDGEPPASREAYDAWITEHFVEPGIIGREELVRSGHSLAPRFIAHQLDQSLQNLELGAIDVYYLHNPEEQLLAMDRGAFRTRLRETFTLLEERADAGAIGGYGCATWLGLRVGRDHKQHLTLADLVAVAREVAGATHHFRAVQLPISLAMPEAARATIQPLGRKQVTLLEAAEALGLGVVASAPIMQGKLAQGLPNEMHELFPGCATDAQRALRFTSSLPGVSVTLAGMRSGAHLNENLGAWHTA
nr:aldo/keto reductase [Gemmatimonadaceae bacterium]